MYCGIRAQQSIHSVREAGSRKPLTVSQAHKPSPSYSCLIIMLVIIGMLQLLEKMTLAVIIKTIMGHDTMLSISVGWAMMMNIIMLVLLKGDDGDCDHPITECSSVQWLDGLGGQV